MATPHQRRSLLALPSLAALICGAACERSGAPSAPPSLGHGSQRLNVSPEIVLPRAPGSAGQSAPSVAVDPQGFLIAWVDADDAGVQSVRALRMTPGGGFVDGTPWAVAANLSNVGWSAVGAMDPSWVAFSDAFKIYGVRVQGGAPLDPVPLQILAGDSVVPPFGLARSSSGTVLVATYQPTGGATTGIFSELLQDDGGVSAPVNLYATAVTQLFASVACEGARCLASWYDPTGSGSRADVLALTAAGAVAVSDAGPSWPACCTCGAALQSAAIGHDAGFVIFENCPGPTDIDLALVTVDAAGRVQQPNGIPVVAGPAQVTAPAAAYDGSELWVAWQDNDGGTIGIRALDVSGNLLDGGVAFEGASPQLAFTGAGQGVVVYLVGDAGMSSSVRARILGPCAVPGSCAIDAGTTDAGVPDGGNAEGGDAGWPGPLHDAVGCGCGTQGFAGTALAIALLGARVRRARKDR